MGFDHWPGLVLLVCYAALAVVAHRMDLGHRRRAKRAAQEEFSLHRAGLAKAVVADDGDAELSPAELGFLAGSQDRSILASLTWLRAAGLMHSRPSSSSGGPIHQHNTDREPPPETWELAHQIRAAADAWEKITLDHVNPRHPSYQRTNLGTGVDNVRRLLVQRGLWEDWKYDKPSERSAWAKAVAVLGVVPLVLVEGILPKLLIVAIMVTLFVLTIPPSISLPGTRGLTPAGEKTLHRARDRHTDLNPATDPPYADRTPEDAAIAVALFGDPALQRADPELHELIQTQSFYGGHVEPWSDTGGAF